MEMDPKIRMTFMCNQNWEEMTPILKGRYCDVCKKEVIDYTKRSVKNIKTERKQTGEQLCGLFRIDQVDENLIKPIEVPSNVKFFAFLSALVFSVTTKSVYSQVSKDTVTEQYANKSKPDLDYRPLTAEAEEKTQNEKIKDEVGEREPFYSTRKKHYYWTKKFPFIKAVPYRFRRAMGRF